MLPPIEFSIGRTPCVAGPAVDGREHLVEAAAGHELRVGIDPPRRRFAERSRLALECDLHDFGPASAIGRTSKRAVALR
jgi:hypothetical protein